MCFRCFTKKNPTVFINGIYGSLIYLPFNATASPVFYIGDHRKILD